MEKDQIKLNDWYRILIGEAPAEFLLEVFVRTLILYVVLLIILRLMGKRMSGQLTISEMAVMITLGAIVSAPMQVPEKGILQGIVILLCALAFQRGLNFLTVKSKKAETLVLGEACLLVCDGRIDLDQLREEKMSTQQLFAMLRNNHFFNLGQIERAYLEANGSLSVYAFSDERPGLSLLAPSDKRDRETQHSDSADHLSCRNCGNTVSAEESKQPCGNCGANTWDNAIYK
jgi:uncharacterized membrane protein YcaP (DUF421 family)